MIYRTFKRSSTGKWLNVVMTVDGPAFAVLASDHRDQIAAGWGISPADMTVVDGSTDARTGTLIEGPEAPAPAPDPDVELAKAISAATTLTELKAALVGKPIKVKARG